MAEFELNIGNGSGDIVGAVVKEAGRSVIVGAIKGVKELAQRSFPEAYEDLTTHREPAEVKVVVYESVAVPPVIDKLAQALDDFAAHSRAQRAAIARGEKSKLTRGY